MTGNRTMVEAKDLARELTQNTGDVLLPLRDASIVGSLELQGHTIEKSIDVRNCIFEEDVDLRNCDFTQIVNFSECVFRKRFRCGDDVKHLKSGEPRTVTTFRQDLICDGATFQGDTSFVRARFEGRLALNGTVFRGPIRLTEASVGDDLSLLRSRFDGPAAFRRLRCEGDGLFHETEFRGGVDFMDATFTGNLECYDSLFEGTLSFFRLQCEHSAMFDNAAFRGPVAFVDASFASTLSCVQALFDDEAAFHNVKCNTGLFVEARFRADAAFDNGVFDQVLSCVRSEFLGPVSFSHTTCTTSLDLRGARFDEAVSFRYATLGQLTFGEDNSSFPVFAEGIDVRNCTLETLDQAVLHTFKGAQDPRKFTMAPYMQLAKYHEDLGDQVSGRRSYYEGRCALRENAMSAMGDVRWRHATRWGDWWLKWLTGYGVYTWRLLVPISVFIIVGLVIFSPRHALEAADTATAQPPIGKPSTTSPSRSETLMVDEPGLLDRVAYDLDVFLPVDLGTATEWTPHSEWRRIYFVLHSMVGWLLVPLFIASLAGIIRR